MNEEMKTWTREKLEERKKGLAGELEDLEEKIDNLQCERDDIQSLLDDVDFLLEVEEEKETLMIE